MLLWVGSPLIYRGQLKGGDGLRLILILILWCSPHENETRSHSADGTRRLRMSLNLIQRRGGGTILAGANLLARFLQEGIAA